MYNMPTLKTIAWAAFLASWGLRAVHSQGGCTTISESRVDSRINGRMYHYYSTVLSCTGSGSTVKYYIGNGTASNSTCYISLGGSELLLSEYPVDCVKFEGHWEHVRWDLSWSRGPAVQTQMDAGCTVTTSGNSLWFEKLWAWSQIDGDYWSNRRDRYTLWNTTCFIDKWYKSTVAGVKQNFGCTGPCTCTAISQPAVFVNEVWRDVTKSRAWQAETNPGFKFCDFNLQTCNKQSLLPYFDFGPFWNKAGDGGEKALFDVMLQMPRSPRGLEMKVRHGKVVVDGQFSVQVTTDKRATHDETCVEKTPGVNRTTLCGGQTSCILLENYLPPSSNECVRAGSSVPCSGTRVVAEVVQNCDEIIADHDIPEELPPSPPESPCIICPISLSNPFHIAIAAGSSLFVVAGVAMVVMLIVCKK